MDLENKNFDNKEILETRKLHTCIKCGNQYNDGEECQYCKNVKKSKQRKGLATINQNIKKRFSSFKNIKALLLSIIFVLFLIGITIFLIVRIPFKYCGTYISYSYYNGNKIKYTYKISPLSIKYIIEYKQDGSLTREKESLKYYKRGGDIIVKYSDSDSENYVIIEDDCLYLETNKDISFSKKYKNYYWNEKSSNADLFEIESKVEGFENMIETITNDWSRELIYKAAEKDLGSSKFYILSSEEESDKTDLNSYKAELKAAGGKLTLYYDRKTKKLESIHFSGIIESGLFSSYDNMDIEDFYDCRAMLLAIMYILGSDNEEELSQNISNLNTTEDLPIRTIATFDYDDLFNNKKVDEKYENKTSYSLSNDRYSIDFENWLTISSYSATGTIRFNIYTK